MKKLIVTVALAFLSAAGYAQQGHASAGVNTGYALDRESVTLIFVIMCGAMYVLLPLLRICFVTMAPAHGTLISMPTMWYL